MESGFVKRNSSNLSTIDLLMLSEFLATKKIKYCDRLFHLKHLSQLITLRFGKQNSLLVC